MVTLHILNSASTTNASLTLRKDSTGADSIDYLQLRSDGNSLICKNYRRSSGKGVVHSTGLVSSDVNLYQEQQEHSLQILYQAHI